jgi:hypothetical protein
MTAGRSSFGKNIIDTDQIFDGCITNAKLATDVNAAIAAVSTALTTATKVVVKYVSIDMTATGTVVTPICTVPSMSIVTDVFTFCETAQTGSGTLTIGDTNNAAGYMADTNITKTLNAVSGDDPSIRGPYLYTVGIQAGTPGFAVSTWAGPRVKFYATATAVNVTNVKGSNTTGQMGIYLIYTKVTPS